MTGMEPDARTLDWIRRTMERMIEDSGNAPQSISSQEIEAIIQNPTADKDHA